MTRGWWWLMLGFGGQPRQKQERAVTLHESTFAYLNPTDEQKGNMQMARIAAKDYAAVIETLVPEGPDKTYALRKFREVAMWVNIAITRQPDGSPRT